MEIFVFNLTQTQQFATKNFFGSTNFVLEQNGFKNSNSFVSQINIHATIQPSKKSSKSYTTNQPKTA
jgi:hypothetical protein